MAFFEERLDPRISRGAHGGPRWSTSEVETRSGRSSTNKNWSMARHFYDVSHGIRTAADIDIVRNFFYVVAGAFDGFRYKDWADYIAAPAYTSLVASGSDWQLQRDYAVGSRVYHRRIQKPVAGSVTIFRTRSGVVTTASATVDATTGLATISGHVSGDTYAWGGQFDVPVRFINDQLPLELMGTTDHLVFSCPSIELKEVQQ